MEQENSKKKCSRFPGVRSRKHKTRKYKGRLDECFFIRLYVDGKLIEEACGWSSDGWYAERAYKRLSEFKENARNGVMPRSMKELRELNKKEQAQQEQLEIEQKRIEDQENITFSTLFKMYADAGAVRKKAKVLMVEEGRFRKWLEPSVGSLPAVHVTPETLEALQASIIDQGRSPQTASHVIDLFRATWRWAQKRKLIQKECPVLSMERVKVSNTKERWFTAEELHSLLKWLAEKDPCTERLVLCAAHTGARLGELAQLEWHHVDFRERQINFIHTKTNKPRSVPMTDELYNMLNVMLSEKSNEYVFLQKSGVTFFHIKNNILLTNTPYFFKMALKELKLNEGHTNSRTKLNFHSLRHTCATSLLRAGTDPRTVQDLLGWSTMKMLERYTHVVPEAKRSAIQSLSEMYK